MAEVDLLADLRVESCCAPTGEMVGALREAARIFRTPIGAGGARTGLEAALMVRHDRPEEWMWAVLVDLAGFEVGAMSDGQLAGFMADCLRLEEIVRLVGQSAVREANRRATANATKVTA